MVSALDSGASGPGLVPEYLSDKFTGSAITRSSYNIALVKGAF